MGTRLKSSPLAMSLLIPLVGLTATLALGRKTVPNDDDTSTDGSMSHEALISHEVPGVRLGRARRRGARLGISIGAVGSIVVLAGGGTAWAYIHGGYGSGTASAKAGTEGSVAASAPVVVGNLYPGGTADLKVTINNPDPNLTMTVLGLVSEGSASIVSGGVGCTTTGVALATPSSITPSTLSPGATNVQITFVGALSMSVGSSNGCQGATFQIPVAVSTKVS